MTKLERIAKQIDAMSPADQLRFCAGILEAVKAQKADYNLGALEIAHATLERVTLELGAAIGHVHELASRSKAAARRHQKELF